VTQIIGAAATVTYTSSGHTSLRAARERPAAPILSITPHMSTARRLAVVWGVHSTISDQVYAESELVSAACKIALREGFAKVGDQLAITAGVPFGQPGSTNLLRLAEVWAD
jgi:pyruvate kinase